MSTESTGRPAQDLVTLLGKELKSAGTALKGLSGALESLDLSDIKIFVLKIGGFSCAEGSGRRDVEETGR